MAKQRRALVAELNEQVAKRARKRSERIVARRLGRRPVTRQVRRNHRRAARQQREDRAPRLAVRGDPMHQQQHRSFTGGQI